MASRRCIFVFYGRNRVFFCPDSCWSSRQIHICAFEEEEEEFTFNLQLINFSLITAYHNSLGLSVSFVLLPQVSQNHKKKPNPNLQIIAYNGDYEALLGCLV